MTPQEIKVIQELLLTRVQPRDVREGVAIGNLVTKLGQHFATPAPAVPPLPGIKNKRVKA